ncbi:YigZ family protein [Marinilongibacter aquaticus]|uniref:IMPACT family protein n=1 Tax=Marinilongibacter aquaticus TaxID=2975157 RepID=UPI0021BDE4A5|nr:YigZ family protein [Marinilongibacter aquaticus]UBM60391.1 YigZ family protein [Marinilongibacter aquaticus]
MSISDTYFTITDISESLFKDKGSKFFGFACPVESEEEVKIFLDQVKTEHPKARHHCFAYRLGLDDNNFRAFDDGEPSGSAGKPILNVLYSANLRNICIVVVRYFGGTLLGVPGLIHAYKSASELAIEHTKLEERIITENLTIAFDVAHMNEVMRLMKKHELNIVSQDYTDRYFLTFEVRLSLREELLRDFEELWFVEFE